MNNIKLDSIKKINPLFPKALIQIHPVTGKILTAIAKTNQLNGVIPA